MTNYFSSDYHLGHDNIRGYCKRPFDSLYYMNSTIIKNHNERVKPTDTVFFLGDFCFRNTKGGKLGEGEISKAEEYLSQLNGRFVFIGGNHDDNNSLNTPIIGALLHFGGKSIWCCHRPTDAEEFVDLNLCGHVHEKWLLSKTPGGVTIYNVGCDMNNFRPITIGEILEKVQKYEKGQIDELGKAKQNIQVIQNERYAKNREDTLQVREDMDAQSRPKTRTASVQLYKDWDKSGG